MEKLPQNRWRAASRFFRIADADTFTHLVFKAQRDFGKSFTGEFRQCAVMHRIVIMETGKQQLQQVFTNLPNCARGRHVVRVAIVQSADRCIGDEQCRHKLVVGFFDENGCFNSFVWRSKGSRTVFRSGWQMIHNL